MAAAAQRALPDLQATVKSNHHLTELVKMTLLKKDPKVLTLHYRMGADPEQTKRRTYKLVTKEAFVAVRTRSPPQTTHLARINPLTPAPPLAHSRTRRHPRLSNATSSGSSSALGGVGESQGVFKIARECQLADMRAR